MSGPKVVKIVTREELIDICRGHIAALEAAAGQWERVCKRNDAIVDADISALQARIVAMKQLLAADNFADVQERVPPEIAFLTADIEERLQKAADAKTSKRAKERRLRAAAATLSRMLGEKQMAVPPELSDPVRFSASEVELAISRAVASVSQAEVSQEPTQRQRELASSLSDHEERMSIASWIQNHVEESNPKLAVLERRLDELTTLDPHSAEAFTLRIQAVSDGPFPRQSMLIDSLTIDVATAQREAKERFGLRAELGSLRAQLALLEGSRVRQRLEEIDRVEVSNPSVGELKAAVNSSVALLEELRNAKAELERRRVLLSGLAELGYEVKEGMETAWVENGRIILKRAAEPDSGVELGGNPQAALQMRPVAFASATSPHDATGDVKAETKFCDDISRLQSKFASTGTEFSVVRAVGVGATPVKTVAIDDERERIYSAADRVPSEYSRR